MMEKPHAVGLVTLELSNHEKKKYAVLCSYNFNIYMKSDETKN